ncbi:acetylornithine deacetylase [Kingella negevensis]|uniref:Acetylornithine deacetylase n=1 Tax=Kingella negevensis TaxID=1522312 RepID=A0A238HJU2_9NEIS|nr:acetylornithine deacetylase [Kingella negevensis]MDK4679708.1 acetylornithine deacetylase [Kingella negevensis]MDK4682573.1 acetylornithine deacetylase [Kingella negevensis]MDK4690770.1 acetylornithine deacetylase [Kingella negevensis]MDK4694082.1 acetylornithine deacetylase [Kingella negevensis]MDK4699811.1 acetylornithine deacetylase [Kingella negevensis]
MSQNLNAQQWLTKLVSFDTTSRHSNLALIECVQTYFSQLGLTCWVDKNATGDKANLFATLPASNGETQGGLVLSGHTDVVPVDGQDWATNPFELTEQNGKLYGRGASDMKGFIASVLALLPEWVVQERKKPIHLALSYDEEVGCIGAPLMIEEWQKRGQKVDGCIVGEPTSMRVVVAHKGISVYQCKVHGKAAHSSLTPQGCNAIEYAARLICRIRDIADAFRAKGPFDGLYDVPYTTMTTNLIQGGIAVNVVPEDCQFQYEFRNLPGVPAAEIQQEIEAYIHNELLPAMRKEYSEAAVELITRAFVPSLEASEQAAITLLACALRRDNEIRKVSYATEAGLFERAGVPTIVCGPGSIEQAHKANEFIEIAQLDECQQFLRKLIAA